jgi:hypothetical protein
MVSYKKGRLYLDGALLPAMVYRHGQRTRCVYLLQEREQISDYSLKSTTMTIAEFDHLGAEEKKTLLQQCCGSNSWVNNMLTALPAEDLVDLLEIAEEQWYACHEPDWREAFSHHPKIGDISTLKEKFASTAYLAEGEQSAVKQVSEQTLQ